MPVYEYHCDSCGFEEEFLQKIRDPIIAECPKCHSTEFRKLLSAAGFQLKGSGWYATDFKGKQPSAVAEKAEKAETKSETSKPAGSCGGGCACH